MVMMMMMMAGETHAFQQPIHSRTGAAASYHHRDIATSTTTALQFQMCHPPAIRTRGPRHQPHQRTNGNGRGIWSSADAVADVYDDDDDGSDNSSSNNNAMAQAFHTSSTVVTNKQGGLLFRGMHVAAEQHPLVQMVMALALYTFHLTVLTQHAVVFPYQLIPTTLMSSSSSLSAVGAAAGTGIGWDSLAGMATLGLYAVYKRQPEQQQQKKRGQGQGRVRVFPWHLPAHDNRHKLSFLITSVLLTQAYFFTGRFSLFWEDWLYTMSARGWPLTAPMHRSLCVLLGHLSWVAAGSAILWAVPRPPPFFGKLRIVPPPPPPPPPPKERKEVSAAETTTTITGTGTSTSSVSSSAVDETRSSASPSTSASASASKYYSWFRSQWNSKWLWWAIGGYFVSSWLFNLADQLNQCILPAQVLFEAQESVVSQLVNPEHNDLLASVVGYIAPCLTAPVWEEVLYRGFALAGLTAWTGRFHWAAVIQAVIFSAHHMSVTAAIPLFVLGWVWALLYGESNNLFTVIFVHALWNSRVFLGSWLGL
jgi:membrane protease YdiL (CAAX protease family)